MEANLFFRLTEDFCLFSAIVVFNAIILIQHASWQNPIFFNVF
jgi:hypothetical protein